MGGWVLYGYVLRDPRFRDIAEDRGPYVLALTDLEAAYLAGIIDGEGTIGIYGVTRNPGYYYLRLIIPNTSEVLIDTLRRWIGGAKAAVKQRDPMCAPAWQLVLTQQRAARVIRVCRPYLIVRSRQADVALDFIDEFESFRGRALPEAEIARRQTFAARMRDLDQPGFEAGLRRWKGQRRAN